MVIRMENENDYSRVYDVVKKAFENAEECDGQEQELVTALRTSDNFVPQLSLVAEVDGEIVGHIMFTKIRIGNNVELALAPLAVIPEYQRQGIGMALIQEGHQRAKAQGYRYSVVLGSEHYYPKAGYVPATKFGIRPSFEVPEQNYMAINLFGENTLLNGVVEYAKEFGLSPEV